MDATRIHDIEVHYTISSKNFDAVTTENIKLLCDQIRTARHELNPKIWKDAVWPNDSVLILTMLDLKLEDYQDRRKRIEKDQFNELMKNAPEGF